MDSRGHGLNHDGRYHTACQIKGQSDSRHRDVVSCGGRCEFHVHKQACSVSRTKPHFIHSSPTSRLGRYGKGVGERASARCCGRERTRMRTRLPASSTSSTDSLFRFIAAIVLACTRCPSVSQVSIDWTPSLSTQRNPPTIIFFFNIFIKHIYVVIIG